MSLTAQSLRKSFPRTIENQGTPDPIFNKRATSTSVELKKFVTTQAVSAVRYWPVAAWSYFVLPEVIEKVGEAAAIAMRSSNLYSGIIGSCSHLCTASFPSILKTVTILFLDKIGHAGQRT